MSIGDAVATKFDVFGNSPVPAADPADQVATFVADNVETLKGK
jgi:hypothetical protein